MGAISGRIMSSAASEAFPKDDTPDMSEDVVVIVDLEIAPI